MILMLYITAKNIILLIIIIEPFEELHSSDLFFRSKYISSRLYY